MCHKCLVFQNSCTTSEKTMKAWGKISNCLTITNKGYNDSEGKHYSGFKCNFCEKVFMLPFDWSRFRQLALKLMASPKFPEDRRQFYNDLLCIKISKKSRFIQKCFP